MALAPQLTELQELVLPQAQAQTPVTGPGPLTHTGLTTAFNNVRQQQGPHVIVFRANNGQLWAAIGTASQGSQSSWPNAVSITIGNPLTNQNDFTERITPVAQSLGVSPSSIQMFVPTQNQSLHVIPARPNDRAVFAGPVIHAGPPPRNIPCNGNPGNPQSGLIHLGMLPPLPQS